MRVHVIVGSDDYLLAQAAKKFITPEAGLEVIDSLTSTNGDLQLKDLRAVADSLAQPPFFEPTKVTWWKNVHFLPGSGKKVAGEEGSKKAPSEEVKEALEKFADKVASLPEAENQCFILTAPKLLKTSLFAKKLGTVGDLVYFEEEKPYAAVRSAEERVLEFATEMGLTFAPGASARFVARVGTDTRSLLSELGKLRDYVGPQKTTIENADIDAVTSQGVGVEPVVWDVTDAIGERDLSATLTAMGRFAGESGFEIFMSGTIEKQFRLMYDLKVAQAANRLSEATAGLNPYTARKNVGFLANWSLAELRAARARFVALREKVVSGLESGEELVTIEVVRALRRRKAAR